MDWEKQIAELLGLKPDAGDQALLVALKAKITAEPSACTHCGALQGQITALKADLETAKAGAGQITALKGQHDQSVTALKAEHTTALTARDTQIAALKKTLAGEVVAHLEETGRIATASKASVLKLAEADPEALLESYRSVKVGTAVPVGQIIGNQRAGVSASKNPSDHVSASKLYATMDQKRVALHEQATAYAQEHKVDYASAVLAVSES